MREFFMMTNICSEEQEEECTFDLVLYYFKFWKKHRGKLGQLEQGNQAAFPSLPNNDGTPSGKLISFAEVVDTLLS
jgi:hypothetical protein